MAGKQREKHRFAREIKRKGKEGARLMATHPGDTKLNEITDRMHTRYSLLPLLPLRSEKDILQLGALYSEDFFFYNSRCRPD